MSAPRLREAPAALIPPPRLLPDRRGPRPLQGAVVRAQEGPGDPGADAHLPGRLLGVQGAAGLGLVPRHLLKEPPSRRRRSPWTAAGAAAELVCLNQSLLVPNQSPEADPVGGDWLVALAD